MAMSCDACGKVPETARAEGNLYPWIKLDFPVNAAINQPSLVEGMRAGFARIMDNRVFCDVLCLRTWLLVGERLIEVGQARTLALFDQYGGTVDED